MALRRKSCQRPQTKEDPSLSQREPISNVYKFQRRSIRQVSLSSDVNDAESLGQNCTTPPFNRNFGIFLGWHVIIWDGSQVKAFPNPDHPPLAIFLTYQAFCTGMKILHFILLRCVKLESEIFLIIQNYVTSNYFS